MTLGERLKFVRKQFGLRQQDIAKSINISRPHYSNIENDTVTPSEKIIHLICTTYKINEDWLSTGKGEPYLEPSSKKDFLEKYMAMKGMFEVALANRENQYLGDTVDSYSYFISLLLSAKTFDSQSQMEEYTFFIKEIIDQLEKYIFSWTVHRRDSKNYEFLYNQKIKEEQLIQCIKKSIDEITKLFLQ